MSVEANKALYRRWINDVWSAGQVTLIDELHTTDYIDHSGLPGVSPDRAGLAQFIAGLRGAYPDLRFTVQDVIAEGDRVVGRWTAQGTHKGSFMGVPPTERTIQMNGIDLLRVVNGRIAEIWHREDELGLLQQLGVMPALGQPAS